LTEAVHRKPYSVILLDEIEKAHRDVFNVLLQVLDDGRLTDGHGRTVDFKNTIIAMTSNIGSEYIANLAASAPAPRGHGEVASPPRDRDNVAPAPRGRRAAGKGDTPAEPDADSQSAVLDLEIEMRVREELKRHFRPEFLNRVDETIIFHRLSQADLVKIAEIQIRQLRQRLADRQITLTLSKHAETKLAHDGYDPAYGARPLKRLIQQEIENPLARRILSGDFAPGDNITIDVTGDVFKFSKAGA